MQHSLHTKGLQRRLLGLAAAATAAPKIATTADSDNDRFNYATKRAFKFS
jgi:hypothetical protein